MNDQANWYIASINTIKASFVELLLARIFGQKIIGTDNSPFGQTKTIGRKYKGKIYLVSFEK